MRDREHSKGDLIPIGVAESEERPRKRKSETAQIVFVEYNQKKPRRSLTTGRRFDEATKANRSLYHAEMRVDSPAREAYH